MRWSSRLALLCISSSFCLGTTSEVSTASKLDPNLRTRRLDRAAAMRELRAVRGEHQFLAAVCMSVIKSTIKSSTLSASAKDEIVKRIMHLAHESEIL